MPKLQAGFFLLTVSRRAHSNVDNGSVDCCRRQSPREANRPLLKASVWSPEEVKVPFFGPEATTSPLARLISATVATPNKKPQCRDSSAQPIGRVRHWSDHVASGESTCNAIETVEKSPHQQPELPTFFFRLRNHSQRRQNKILSCHHPSKSEEKQAWRQRTDSPCDTHFARSPPSSQR